MDVGGGIVGREDKFVFCISGDFGEEEFFCFAKWKEFYIIYLLLGGELIFSRWDYVEG